MSAPMGTTHPTSARRDASHTQFLWDAQRVANSFKLDHVANSFKRDHVANRTHDSSSKSIITDYSCVEFATDAH